MKTPLISIVTMMLVAATALSGVVLSRFEARSVDSEMEISWQASVEEGVTEYILERKTRFDAQFTELKRFKAHGKNKLYLHRDDQIYKAPTEQVEYRLRIVNTDRSFTMIDPISVNYTPTAIRRTWGSIKAMFQ